MVTGDLDMLQIVDDATTVLTTRRGISDLGRYDRQAVLERFELEPAQLPDYRGLKGDPSDNLPGIPGIGEKTAIKLIKAAGSLDALLANPALAGTPKLEALIREHGETARVCRDVSLVLRDLPLDVPWDQARYVPPAGDRLYPLYRELEFKMLLGRLEVPSAVAATAANEERHRRTVRHLRARDGSARLRAARGAAASGRGGGTRGPRAVARRFAGRLVCAG